MAGQGSLTINSVALAASGNVGWKIRDLSPLWFPPDVRGNNVVIPGTAGRRAYVKRVDETVYQLPMTINGYYNMSGTPYADTLNGLQTNLEYLYANVIAPTIGTTVSATLTWPSGTTKTASVQCQLDRSEVLGNVAIRAVLYVTVPAGRFA